MAKAQRARSTRGLQIEVLCDHHSFEDFDSGDRQINVALAAYMFNLQYNLDALLIALSDVAGTVQAYISIVEVEIVVSDDLSGPFSGLYFFIPAVGVARAYHGSDAFRRLFDHAAGVMLKRIDQMRGRERRVHKGVLCQTRTNPALARALRLSGFVDMPGKPFYTVLLFDDGLGRGGDSNP